MLCIFIVQFFLIFFFDNLFSVHGGAVSHVTLSRRQCHKMCDTVTETVSHDL